MDEVRKLRMTLRLAESERRGTRRIAPASVKDREFQAWP
jgi:hypothetical protein